ncbi:MAG TPA: ROK family transcriptional regulator [Acidimicrobiales bacterium]|nr:ROK family transcriptional regulator [Acidimicrobiales bacterium]
MVRAAPPLASAPSTRAATPLARPAAGTDHGGGVRLSNMRLVLRELRRHGPASRAEIASRVGLTRPTLTRIAAELIDLGLVREAGLQSGRPGRPGTSLELDGAHVVAVGAELNVDAITVIVHDLSGRERSRMRQSLEARRLGPELSARRLASLCLRAVAKAAARSAAPPAISGVVVAVPGIVDTDGGVLVESPNLHWKDVPLARLTSQALGIAGVAVSVGNAANLAAVAEYWRGGQAGRRNLVYVTGDVGAGGGVLVEGELLRGVRGRAAEIGHMVVDPDGPACGCGRSGCWEAFIGLDAFLASVGLPASEDRPEAVVRQVAAQARRGDAGVLAGLERLGFWVGIGAANLVNLLDTEVVILGGYFTHLAQWMLPAAYVPLARQVIVSDVPPEKLVVTSALGFRASALGAALHASEAVFSDPRLYAPPGS